MDRFTKETHLIKEESTWSVLEQLARQGAQKMLQLALENEVEEFVKKHSNLTGENGKKVVTKNGCMPAREILTGMGPLPIKQPRIDDRGLRGYERFLTALAYLSLKGTGLYPKRFAVADSFDDYAQNDYIDCDYVDY